MCEYKREKKDEAPLSGPRFCPAGLPWVMEGIDHSVAPGNLSHSALDRPLGPRRRLGVCRGI